MGKCVINFGGREGVHIFSRRRRKNRSETKGGRQTREGEAESCVRGEGESEN